uniref:Uncharacterized protein n=1 Tax=Rhizophora mucronata TaxID=61149 RepID=A0A2P2Q526_RHIMU
MNFIHSKSKFSTEAKKESFKREMSKVKSDLFIVSCFTHFAWVTQIYNFGEVQIGHCLLVIEELGGERSSSLISFRLLTEFQTDQKLLICFRQTGQLFTSSLDKKHHY